LCAASAAAQAASAELTESVYAYTPTLQYTAHYSESVTAMVQLLSAGVQGGGYLAVTRYLQPLASAAAAWATAGAQQQQQRALQEASALVRRLCCLLALAAVDMLQLYVLRDTTGTAAAAMKLAQHQLLYTADDQQAVQQLQALHTVVKALAAGSSGSGSSAVAGSVPVVPIVVLSWGLLLRLTRVHRPELVDSWLGPADGKTIEEAVDMLVSTTYSAVAAITAACTCQ
jgi:hypothetical protein